MKIATWNCNGGFRNKIEPLSAFDADIYIIQECEDPSRVTKSNDIYKAFSENHIWIGENKNKGLGVFTRNSSKISMTELNQDFGSSKLKWFLPFRYEDRLDFVGAWAHRGDTGEFRYIGQFYWLLKNNMGSLNRQIFIGDLNSNKIWDYKRSEGDHSTCVRMLQEVGIHSVYHYLKGQEQGLEADPTFYLQKNWSKPYHIDYVFAPLERVKKTVSLEVGKFESWQGYSDHVPMVWEFDET